MQTRTFFGELVGDRALEQRNNPQNRPQAGLILEARRRAGTLGSPAERPREDSADLRTDFQPLLDADPGASKHEAWFEFTCDMRGRCFGGEALIDAWRWYSRGYDAGWARAGGEP